MTEKPAWVAAAQQALREDRLDETLRLCEQALELRPDDLAALFLTIQIYERRASFVAAAQFLLRLRSLAATLAGEELKSWCECTDRDRVLFYAGVALLQSQRYGEAFAFFTQIRSSGFPRKPSLYYTGLCCLHGNEPQTAAKCLRLLLSGAPAHVDAWFNLGNAEALAGQTAEAERCYRQAMAMEPDFAEAAYNLDLLVKKSPQTEPPGLKSRYWQEAPTPDDIWQVPIIINCRDRVFALRQMVDWLQGAGYRNIILLDNASTYPPLLAYYQELTADAGNEKVRLVRLTENLGHQALWRSGVLRRLGIDGAFVYSDPDIVPIAECPHDVLAVFWRILQDNPFVQKVGFGLKIDDLPDHFHKKSAVQFHEAHFWEHRMPQQVPAQYFAPIDTTFALYRHGNYYEIPYSIRTGFPYLARHSDWYLDSVNMPDEIRYYYANAQRGVSWTQRL